MITLEIDLFRRAISILKRILRIKRPYAAVMTFQGRGQEGRAPELKAGESARTGPEYFEADERNSLFLSQSIAEFHAGDVALARGVTRENVVSLIREHVDLAPLIALNCTQGQATSLICIPLINLDLDRLFPIIRDPE